MFAVEEIGQSLVYPLVACRYETEANDSTNRQSEQVMVQTGKVNTSD